MNDASTHTGRTADGGWTVLRIGIVALALATAIIHVVLAYSANLVEFYANGLGYLVLVTALYLPRLERFRSRIRWLLINYTVLTILLWAAFGQPYTTIGYVDKAIEVGLAVLLWLDHRRSAEQIG